MKKILIIFLLALAGVVQGQTFKTLATSAGLEQLPSYTIQEISGTVYARPALNSGYTAYADTNLTSVLNNAINALTNGGLIQIKAGTYDHLSMIKVVKNNITIQGEGKYVTKLKLMADGDTEANGTRKLIYVDEFDNFQIKDLELDGNGANQFYIDNADGTPNAVSVGIYLSDSLSDAHSNNFYAENLYVHDFAQTGIVWRGVNAVIKNCDFVNNYWCGVQFYPSAVNGRIEDCYFRKNCLGTLFGKNHVVSNCVTMYPYNAHSWAVYQLGFTIEGMAGDGNDPENITIRDCFFRGDSLFQFISALNSPDNFTIDGLELSGAALTGSRCIYIEDDTNTVVQNVHIYDFTSDPGIGLELNGSINATVSNLNMTGPCYIGISLRDNATGCNLINNTIKATEYCIEVQAGATDNILIGNLLWEASANELSDSGTGTKFKSNYKTYAKGWVADN